MRIVLCDVSQEEVASPLSGVPLPLASTSNF